MNPTSSDSSSEIEDNMIAVNAAPKKRKAQSTNVAIMKNSIAQGLSTLLSRISGLIRDVFTATFLGATPLSDAFFVAFRVPNSIRKLIGEGALSPTFVPIFIQHYSTNKELAKRFASFVVFLLFCVSLACVIAGELFTPNLIDVIAPGFKDSEQTRSLAIALTRITLPFMITICIVATLGGILNSINLFFGFAATPIILNVTMTLFLMAGSVMFHTEAYMIAIAVSVSGVLQLIFMVYLCKKHNVMPNLKSLKAAFYDSELKSSIKTFSKRLFPILFGQGIFQINMFINGRFASFSASTVSYLYYSDRLSQFVTTIIGHTLGTVALPMLATKIAASLKDDAMKVQHKCINWAIIWGIPASICLAVLAQPITQLIYQRGDFDSTDTMFVATMLQISCISIPFFSINRIFYSCIYALHKTKIPAVIGVISIFVNIAVNLMTMESYPHYHVIIAITVAGMMEFALLALTLKFAYKFLAINWKTIETAVKTTLITLSLSSLVYAFFPLAEHNLGLFFGLAATILSTIIAYVLAIIRFDIIKYDDIDSMIKNKRHKLKIFYAPFVRKKKEGETIKKD